MTIDEDIVALAVDLSISAQVQEIAEALQAERNRQREIAQAELLRLTDQAQLTIRELEAQVTKTCEALHALHRAHHPKEIPS